MLQICHVRCNNQPLKTSEILVPSKIVYSNPSKLHIKLNLVICRLSLQQRKPQNVKLKPIKAHFMMMQQYVRFSLQMSPLNNKTELQGLKAHFL